MAGRVEGWGLLGRFLTVRVRAGDFLAQASVSSFGKGALSPPRRGAILVPTLRSQAGLDEAGWCGAESLSATASEARWPQANPGLFLPHLFCSRRATEA